MATKPPNGIYTFSGRPGSTYKYENNQWFVSNSGTKNQYVTMQDPTGNRAKTLEAGLQSGKTKFSQILPTKSSYNQLTVSTPTDNTKVIQDNGLPKDIQEVARRQEAAQRAFEEAKRDEIKAAPEYTTLDKIENIVRNPLVAASYAMQPGAFNMPMNYSEYERSPNYNDPVWNNNLVGQGLNTASYFTQPGLYLHGADNLMYTNTDLSKAIESGKMSDWKQAGMSALNSGLDILAGSKYIGASGRLLNMGERATLEAMKASNKLNLPAQINTTLGNKVYPRFASTMAKSADDLAIAKMFPQINPNSIKYNPITRSVYNKAVSIGHAQNVGEALGLGTDKFKSEIDWGKWNKEIPDNPQLMKEYNAIEQQAKADGTWMKNPDGSEFTGSNPTEEGLMQHGVDMTPEEALKAQFVQQKSENFKNAFGDSKLVNPDGSPTIQYHGSAKKFDTFDESKFQLGDSGYSGRGIYTTPDKNKASSYSLSSKNIHKDGNYEPTVYELYGQGNNPISAEDLINQKKEYDLFNFHRQKDWRGDVPLEEQMLDYDVAIRNQTRGIERVSPWNQANELVFPTNKQLKSAIGNNGDFDMSNPNIYKSLLPYAVPVGLGLGLGAAQKYPNGGGMQTVKSKDGTVTNKFTNAAGNTVVQVKTKDGRYYEKVVEPQIKPLDTTPRYQNALANYPAIPADNTRVANADFAAAAVANKPNVDRAVAAEKKAQYEFEKDKWEDYDKMSPTEKVVDRVDAFLTDPLGMVSRAVSGEQAYIPGMGQGLVDYENPNRNRYLQAVGYTPGKFEASDIQNMANPGYWGASITNNLNKGNYGTAATETALSFLPFLPKGSAGLARQGAGMIADDIARGYNNVATGNTFLTDLGVRAWKNPAANLDGAVSETMFNKILQSDNFTPAEKAMLKEYQFGNYSFVKPGTKQDAFNELIGKANLIFPEDAVVTRAFTNPETELQAFTGAADDIKTISMQERPSAFSAGVSNKDKYYYDDTNRIVLSGKNLKKVEDNFIKQRYQPLEEGYYTNIPDEELTVGDYSKKPGDYGIGDTYYGTSRLTPDEVTAQAEAVYAKNNALYSDTSKTWLKPSDDPNFLTGKPKSNNPADGVYTAKESAEILKNQQNEYQEKLRLFTDPANKKEAIQNLISDARKGFANQKGPSDELELFGSGFDMKVVGKFPNKHGGFDYVVKPKNIKKLKEPDITSMFKSGLGNAGMDMSMYTIKNPDYFTQLLGTYDKKALSATNRKFYKELIESVKKQEGLVTERQLNELRRLETGNFDFGRKGYNKGYAEGGSLAKNIPTYYDYSGTPIYRDTTALPFPDGGYLSLQNAMLGPLPEKEKPNSVLAYNKFVEATKTPNQSAYIRPSYYPGSNHYKYGFFGTNSGNIYGGAGYGVPKYGLEGNLFGVVPTEKNPYFKGFYNAGLSKQIGANKIGLSVGSPVTGYTDEAGFHANKLQLEPQINFKRTFADGGILDRIRKRLNTKEEEEYNPSKDLSLLNKYNSEIKQIQDLEESDPRRIEYEKANSQFVLDKAKYDEALKSYEDQLLLFNEYNNLDPKAKLQISPEEFIDLKKANENIEDFVAPQEFDTIYSKNYSGIGSAQDFKRIIPDYDQEIFNARRLLNNPDYYMDMSGSATDEQISNIINTTREKYKNLYPNTNTVGFLRELDVSTQPFFRGKDRKYTVPKTPQVENYTDYKAFQKIFPNIGESYEGRIADASNTYSSGYGYDRIELKDNPKLAINTYSDLAGRVVPYYKPEFVSYGASNLYSPYPEFSQPNELSPAPVEPSLTYEERVYPYAPAKVYNSKANTWKNRVAPAGSLQDKYTREREAWRLRNGNNPSSHLPIGQAPGGTFADGGPLNDKTNHGKILDSVYASAIGDYYANGGMLKRADGSYSRRGLWDNIRANRGSGKAPTKEMLAQEKKINTKANGGFVAGRQMYQPLDIRESYGGFLYGNGGQFPTTFSLPEDSFKQGGNNLHDSVYASSMAQYPAVYGMGGNINVVAGGEKHRVYIKESPTGMGEGVKGHVMVNHPTMDKGQWDTIDLTKKAGAKTVKQGIAATKKWHRENPQTYSMGGSILSMSNTPQLEGEGKDLSVPENAYIYSAGGSIKKFKK